MFTQTEIGLMGGGAAAFVLVIAITICLVKRYKRKVRHRVVDANYFVESQQRKLAKAMVVEAEDSRYP